MLTLRLNTLNSLNSRSNRAVWRTFILSGLLSLTFSAQSVAQADEFRPPSPIVKLMPVLLDNLSLLELTAKQTQQARVLAQQNFQALAYLNAQYQDMKAELKELLLSPELTSEQTDRLSQSISQLEQKRLKLTIDCAEGLKQILTPDQFKELVDIAYF